MRERLLFILPLLFISLLFSCQEKRNTSFSPAQRHEVDSIVRSVHGTKGLDSLYNVMLKEKFTFGRVVVLREWGKQLRNESRFDEALERHGEGMKIAEQIGDTLELIQALNNIGTDYRRMGILDAALQYHKNALKMSEESSDKSFTARKNYVVSLNGLANVYLTIGNYHLADSCLRQALAGERALGSLTGQAINYANLGSIFETRGQTDSAWTYYRKSMELNIHDSNTLGIALCHTYYGNLYEKAHKLDKALNEYSEAYKLMKDSKDEWHTLNALTALAGVYIAKGEDQKAESRLHEAKAIAADIHSTEHLAEIYTLYYKLHKSRGDWRGALLAHEQATALQDSLIDMDKVNQMQSVSFSVERGQQSRRMTAANNRLRSEKSARLAGYIIFAVLFALLALIIGLLIYNRRLRTRSYRELKKLNDIRETFFRNITHEFRTPLTVILGLSDDLQQPETTTDEARDMGRTIHRQGQHMLRLINQLLDISKIKSEIGTPDWSSGDIVAYVRMIVESFTSLANDHGIKLQFVSREKKLEINFVSDYVNKVIGNLLSNALKFTPRNGTVNVTMWHDGQSLYIDVADNGRGISTQSLPHIFEEFYQSDNADGGVGTGVGLALAYQIVKSLDGNITVDSIEGQGTTFHIMLPAPLHTKEDLSEGQASTEAPRVLIVEDNTDIAALIGKRLSDSYVVDYASNGKQGLKKAHEWMPDIIITDLMMPEMDGLELCRQIRNDVLTSHIPIIVVTAKVTEAERVEGLKAGADAYLIKPFNSDELTTRVEKLLEQRRMLRDKFAKEALSQPYPTGDGKGEASSQLNDLDRRFLNKVTDSVYLLLGSRKSVDVGAVAKQVCMSYGQFNRKISALTGYTPAQYIQRVKIKKAQRMLTAHPELGFNDVAEQCGFSDYSNFVRAFRNVLGITPTQYVRSVNIK